MTITGDSTLLAKLEAPCSICIVVGRLVLLVIRSVSLFLFYESFDEALHRLISNS